MTGHIEQSARDDWYTIGTEMDLPAGSSVQRLLGTDLDVEHDPANGTTIRENGRALPVVSRFGMVWTSLGSPGRDLFDIDEATEPDRRIVPCGAVSVRASGLRIIENFLDLAHFPFVHTDVLGAEPHTEVPRYDVEIRRQADEVWATDCSFFQPQAALSASEGIMTRYIYRVMTPFNTLLYKTCPNADDRWDVICLFVQPIEPDFCRAHPLMYLIDETSTTASLIQFQQMIFLQDRIILENQRPVLLPLEARAEIPTRADATSIAYRRWLKEKGIVYGTSTRAA